MRELRYQEFCIDFPLKRQARVPSLAITNGFPFLSHFRSPKSYGKCYVNEVEWENPRAKWADGTSVYAALNGTNTAIQQNKIRNGCLNRTRDVSVLLFFN